MGSGVSLTLSRTFINNAAGVLPTDAERDMSWEEARGGEGGREGKKSSRELWVIDSCKPQIFIKNLLWTKNRASCWRKGPCPTLRKDKDIGNCHS